MTTKRIPDELLDQLHAKSMWGIRRVHRLGRIAYVVYCVKGNFPLGSNSGEWAKYIRIHPRKKAPYTVEYHRLVLLSGTRAKSHA